MAKKWQGGTLRIAGKVVARVWEKNAGVYVWDVGTTSGEARSEDAAQRAARRALREGQANG
jgi:hypothetical protein